MANTPKQRLTSWLIAPSTSNFHVTDLGEPSSRGSRIPPRVAQAVAKFSLSLLERPDLCPRPLSFSSCGRPRFRARWLIGVGRWEEKLYGQTLRGHDKTSTKMCKTARVEKRGHANLRSIVREAPVRSIFRQHFFSVFRIFFVVF